MKRRKPNDCETTFLRRSYQWDLRQPTPPVRYTVSLRQKSWEIDIKEDGVTISSIIVGYSRERRAWEEKIDCTENL